MTTDGLEQVTHHVESRRFPMFSPDGTKLVWASGRSSKEGELNPLSPTGSLSAPSRSAGSADVLGAFHPDERRDARNRSGEGDRSLSVGLERRERVDQRGGSPPVSLPGHASRPRDHQIERRRASAAGRVFPVPSGSESIRSGIARLDRHPNRAKMMVLAARIARVRPLLSSR
jgi:hypothetical protein